MGNYQLDQLLKELSEFGAVSGDEFRMSVRLQEIFSEFGFEVTNDFLGDIVLHIKGKPGAKKVLIYSHFDEPGFVVSQVDEQGFLEFEVTGDVTVPEMGAQELWIYGQKKIPGLIGLRPPHILSDEERKAPVSLDELRIDIGCHADLAKKLVNIGDTASFRREFARHLGGEVCGKALSCRAGAAVLYQTLCKLSDCGLDLYFALGARHFTANAGVVAVAESVQPDAAIVIDSLDAASRENPDYPPKCGEGPAIFTGPTSDPELTGALIKFAESSSINYQLRAAAEPEESEAWPLQVACGGIPLAVISIPVKYRYSSVEEANLGDLETAAELLSGYLTILEKADWGKLLCC